jgi:hypothetical protein
MPRLLIGEIDDMPAIRRSVFQGICVAVPLSLIWAVSSAQYGGVPQGVDVTKWKATKFQGKVDSASGNTLTAVNFGNERIFIYVSPGVTKQISVKGTAEPSAIKSGMGIRFAGKVDETGAVADAVTDIYLISPDGALSEFDVGEDTEIEGTIASYDMKGNMKVLVNGVKKEMKGEKTVILKRVKMATVKLADDVKVNVDMADPSLARKEDSLNVVGRIVKANNKVDQPNHILAESLIIEMSQPLTGKRGKPAAETAAPAKKEREDPFKEGAKQAEGAKPAVPEKKAPEKEAPKKEAGKKLAAAK